VNQTQRAVLPRARTPHDFMAAQEHWAGRLARRENVDWVGQVRLRPAVEADQAKLAAMLAGLSPDSRYRRFLTGVGTPPAALLKALVRSGEDGASWLAVAQKYVVAHASWGIEPGAPDRIAELAVVTADAWQGRGLGIRLLAAVAANAMQAGATALRLYVLADNRRLIARLHRQWPDTTPRRDGTLLIYTIPATMTRS
jgi:GNAT superfamily N-acetyltransferase